VHFGVGNFHRAHMAVYLDALFNSGRDRDWAIIGAGVLPSDETMSRMLAGQDFLTTVVDQSAGPSVARVSGSMIDFQSPDDPAAIIRTLADPAIRIGSLTITEGGYFINPATGLFDHQSPAIAADAAHPESPKTVFGLIIAGLKARRQAGIQPFTVMSCDNVPHNGVVARNAVAGLARLFDPGLSDWIIANVAFPNAMVDRITPATGDRERQILARDFAIADAWPVFCEDFSQWVLEDRFPAGRPALETVGVEFVADVTPYENMKIRILNGGHAVIAYPAGLMDIHFAHEAMEHPLILGFLRKVENEEIIPIVPPVPNTDLHAYYKKTESRFANPKIGDTIRRLCLDGSNRQPKFIIPSIADRLTAGLGIDGLALESALWCRYCFGTTDSGQVIEANDPNWDRLVPVARAARDDPMAWLRMTDIYGEVGRSEVFRTRFASMLQALWIDGVERMLTRYVLGAI
jgi:mannitol 2-dehydrogenase